VNPPTVVRVTADHIAAGEHRDACWCPIALAIRELWPGRLPGGVEVGGYQPGFARVHDGGWWRAELPAAAQVFMRDFDERSPVEPFEFVAEWTAPDGATP
jgi:hypothetical protein